VLPVCEEKGASSDNEVRVTRGNITKGERRSVRERKTSLSGARGMGKRIVKERGESLSGERSIWQLEKTSGGLRRARNTGN